jgi:hypothetical protein
LLKIVSAGKYLTEAAKECEGIFLLMKKEVEDNSYSFMLWRGNDRMRTNSYGL